MNFRLSYLFKPCRDEYIIPENCIMIKQAYWNRKAREIVVFL